MPIAAPAPRPNGHRVLRRAAWLVPLGLASYGLRFASSWLVLAWAGDKRFDPHGFGLLGDGMLLPALAPVMGGLLGCSMLNRVVQAVLAFLLAASSAFAAVPPGVTRQLPAGYNVLGSASMQVGAPARSVVIVALGRDRERDTQRGGAHAPARPLLIFAHRPDGGFTRIGRNDHVVNRADEGGQCDPFLDGGGVIAVRGPFFTVQNGVACGPQHWTDYVTFRFVGARGGFVFDNERSESWKLNPSREPNAEALVHDGPPRIRRGDAGQVIGFDAWHPAP